MYKEKHTNFELCDECNHTAKKEIYAEKSIFFMQVERSIMER